MTTPRGSADRHHRRRLAAGVVFALEILSASALEGQELPLQRDYPGSGRPTCSAQVAPLAPSVEARAQAIELTSGSDQSLILGDLPQAAALLDRAIELDPASAELAYRRARLWEQVAEPSSAVAEYCRALSLAPEGQIGDASVRLEVLLEEQRTALPAEAIAALESGLAAADRGAMLEALAFFQVAAARAPQWATAQYNRGVALAWRGRRYEAVAALLRYLELRPGAPDAIAVSRRVGQLQSLAAAAGPSPRVAVALGALVPGMGQFYTRRPLGGLAVMSLAGGVVAAGLLVTEVNVRCLTSVPAGERCPRADVVSRDTSRPYLTLAVGTAAVAGLVGALEAFFNARGRRSRAPAGFGSNESRGPTLERPAVAFRSGQVELSLVRLRFR